MSRVENLSKEASEELTGKCHTLYMDLLSLMTLIKEHFDEMKQPGHKSNVKFLEHNNRLKSVAEIVTQQMNTRYDGSGMIFLKLKIIIVYGFFC